MLRGLSILATALLLAFTIAITLNYFRPLPEVAATSSMPPQAATGAAPALPWPVRGSAALAVPGLGIVASTPAQPGPTASVAKVMTALLILEDRPLRPGESGPSLTITPADVQLYLRKRANDESVLRVAAGEQLTELQCLTALMLPSANNIADLLAVWDAGSVDAFIQKMNARARAMNLAQTSFADTHGADSRTVSVPSDLVLLGMAAMRDPVFASVVGLIQADLPVAGTVYNVDYVLGQSGIVGIKTGSGGDLGANFLWAATAGPGGRPVLIYGCVMGQTSLDEAFRATKALIAAMSASLTVQRVIARGQVVGRYQAPWGDSTALIAAGDVDVLAWPGIPARQRLAAPSQELSKPLPAGALAGVADVSLGEQRASVQVVTERELRPPSNIWRLTRYP